MEHINHPHYTEAWWMHHRPDVVTALSVTSNVPEMFAVALILSAMSRGFKYDSPAYAIAWFIRNHVQVTE